MTALLQPDSLNQLKTILEDDFLQITQLFADQLPAEIDALQLAIDANDMIAINQKAHSIKGSCANLGAVALAHQAMLIEKAAQVCDMAVIHASAATLPDLADQTLAGMRESGFLAP